jgi:hypothetical protein
MKKICFSSPPKNDRGGERDGNDYHRRTSQRSRSRSRSKKVSSRDKDRRRSRSRLY